MKDYFVLSLIVKKRKSSHEIISSCLLDNFQLFDGEREVEYFGNDKVIVFYPEVEAHDFFEVAISIPNVIFHKEKFQEELELFTTLSNRCFKCCKELEFILCSFELNGYLLRNVTNFDDFNLDVLGKFPIIYWRDIDKPVLQINLKAQEIW